MTRTPLRASSVAVLVVLALVATVLTAVVGVRSNTAAASPGPYGLVTLFGDQAPAGAVMADDAASVELGTEFVPSAPGAVATLRFYKAGPEAGDEHVGRLWRADGTLLAEAKFQQESASGWQTASLSQPIEVTPGELLVVSYLASGGRYAVVPDALGKPTQAAAGPWSTIPSEGGVFRYGPGGFPKDRYRASNYQVDVGFVPKVSMFAGSPETVPAAQDPAGVELGLRFVPKVGGTVTALRYLAASDPGTARTGRVWSPEGAVLAEAVFPGSESTGWQTAALDQPLRLEAGRQYVVSYRAESGGYASAYDAFPSPVDGGWYTIPRDGGVYRYGPAGDLVVPARSHRASTYFLDIEYLPTGGDAGSGTQGQAGSPFLVVDQFGYQPAMAKTAVIRDPQVGYDADQEFVPGPQLAVVDAASGAQVLSGAPVPWRDGAVDESSGDRIWTYDFSGVKQPGRYFVLDIASGTRSAEFRIAPDVYNDVLRAALRTFFYQRAGQDKPAELAGERWADAPGSVAAGQARSARLYRSPNDAATERDLSGGWYDAGDANIYTNWHAGYAAALLHAYRDSPGAFDDAAGIPESGNGFPDVVDEARWGLDWLMRMQNDDGSVLSILSNAQGSPPSSATGPSLYGDPSTSATLSAATAFATAAALIKPEEGLSAEHRADLLRRAELAWGWSQANPSVTFFNNDAVHGTQGLGSGQQETDDAGRQAKQLQAAAALFAATGKPVYRDAVDVLAAQAPLMAQGTVSAYDGATIDALLWYAKTEGATPDFAAKVLERFGAGMQGQPNLAAFRAAADPYRAFLPTYHWGSNGAKAAQGVLFGQAARLSANDADRSDAAAAAADVVHGLHGVNPLARVSLTNMGGSGAESSATRMFHFWFGHSNSSGGQGGASPGPPPGFLVGGPNPGYALDPCCAGWCPGADENLCDAQSFTPPLGQPPQKSYRDFDADWPANSWTVTENSNGYQVAYLRVLAGVVSAEQAKSPVPPGPAAASALISRGQPVFASTGTAAAATDDDGESAWRPDAEEQAWLALDLSAVPAARRKHVVLAWFASPDDGYSIAEAQGTCPAWPGRPYLSDYLVEVNRAGPGEVPSSGWTPVATVQGNARLAGQHQIDLSTAPWVRIRGSGPNGVAINVEVVSTDAGGGAGWLFVGDSITARYAGHQPVTDPSGAVLQSFSALVSQRTGGRAWPLAQNAGMSCSRAWDALAWIDPMLDAFPGRYVALNFGTNDSWGGFGNPDEFKGTMAEVVAKVVAHGKIPVVPTIPWPNNGGDWQAMVEEYNVRIRQLYQDDPGIVAGPDLYAITKDRPELFDGAGNVHPNTQGSAEMRSAWAGTAAQLDDGTE